MRVVLAFVTVCTTLLVGCTDGGSTHPITSEGTPCPSGDKPPITPTYVLSTGGGGEPLGKVTVLARTSPGRPAVVHAVVTYFGHPKPKPEIKTMTRSRILLVKRVWETVAIAHGDHPLVPEADVLAASNVIAASPFIRTTDLKNHLLTLDVPVGLRPRDYFLIGDQVRTALCGPGGAGPTSHGQTLVGLVRVTRSN